MTSPGMSERAVAGDPDTARSSLSQQNSVYRRTMAVCDELAGAALGGADLARLTEVFAQSVGKRVVLLNTAFRLRAQAGGSDSLRGLRWNRTDPSVDRLLRALESARRPLRIPAIPGSLLDQACLVAPVVVRETNLGYLLVLDEAAATSGYLGLPDDADFLTITYAATLFALILAHEQTSAELDVRYRASVVDALISGHFLDAHDARRKARSLGLRDGVPLRVAMLRPLPPDLVWAQRILRCSGIRQSPSEAVNLSVRPESNDLPGPIYAWVTAVRLAMPAGAERIACWMASARARAVSSVSSSATRAEGPSSGFRTSMFTVCPYGACTG